MSRSVAQSLSLWMASADLPTYAPLRQNIKTDVCIVGGGIAGLCTAYQLAKAGRHVVVVTQEGVGHGETMRTSAHLAAALDIGIPPSPIITCELTRWSSKSTSRTCCLSAARTTRPARPTTPSIVTNGWNRGCASTFPWPAKSSTAAALISAAQRIEHYETAGYGSARTFAQHLGHATVARLLQTTLDEEKETDKHLPQLAEEGINVKAESAMGGQGKSWES
jgi:glycine/D-amino acid oxidase-like deaminating enzyme